MCGHFEREHGAHEHAAAGGRPFAFTTSPRHFERPRPFAIQHIALDLTLDFPTRSVKGTTTLRLRRVDPEATSVDLDAIGFTIASITVAEKDADYTYDGRVLTIQVPPSADRFPIVVTYEATPRKGLYFLDADEHVPNRPRQAWTQLQEEDARHLFPCHDKPHVKMTTEARVRVPAGFYVLSNGALINRAKDSEGASEIFHWKMDEPHPSYLVTIVAGEFTAIEDVAHLMGESPELEETVKVESRHKTLVSGSRGSAEGGTRDVPVTYLVPKGRETDGKRTFARTPQMIQYFSELLHVPYPWNKYAQVVVSDFIFGGMENTTATTMYEHILLDERAALDVSSEDLIAHELAHQWFGDLVTCRDWSEGWLNEGFATFMEHVWREHVLGKDEYDYGIRNDLANYLAEASGRYKRAIVCQDYDAPLDLFDRHLYEKGGLVLHILKTELGDALFWKGITTYLHRHARGVVETRDLMRALEEVSGRSLGRRFEELVYKPGHADVDIDVSWSDGILSVAARQTQATADGVPNVFEVPIVLTLATGTANQTVKLRLAARSDTFAIPCPQRPLHVVVDPFMQILGEVTLKAPADMLRNQLQNAPTARGRWLAAAALARVDDPPTIAALAAQLENDKEAWMVRVECAEALGKIRARECFEVLVRGLAISHPKVRRAVCDALGRFKTADAVKALQPKALRDESYLVEAEAARSLGKTRQTAAFDTLLDVLGRPSWAEVITAAAIDGLAQLRDDRALPHLYTRTRYGHPSRVRRAAVMAIPKLATDRRAREHLEELLDDNDFSLRLDVARALNELGDARARSALGARVQVELDPRARRRMKEAIRDLGADRSKAQKPLEDQIERLENEQKELKARLAKLELRTKETTAAPSSDSTKAESRSPKKAATKKK